MISEFRGTTRWLSNFWMVDIFYEGNLYPSTEHAYQAMKCKRMEDRIYIGTLKRPGEAKKAGMEVELREDWSDVRLEIMEDITRLKFRDPELKAMLLATGDEELVEGNTWNDTFWGVCKGVGENNLGKIIMKIREEIKNENKH